MIDNLDAAQRRGRALLMLAILGVVALLAGWIGFLVWFVLWIVGY